MKKMIYKESFSLKFYFIFLFLILIAKTIYGQSNVIIGKVFNVKTNKPIAFATIVLKNNNLGLYANEEGDFTIRNSEIYQKDLLLISSIGYEKKSILFNQLKKGEINNIYLTPAIENLEEILIKTGKKRKKRIRSKKLIREAIKRIPENYPTSPFSLVSYYREYLKRSGNYSNLDEAIVQTIDSGFKTPHYYNKFRLLDYKRNRNFPRETFIPEIYDTIWQSPDYTSSKKYIPYAKIPNQGGNELFILLAHDPIRNYNTSSFAFIYKLSRDFLRNHSFEKPIKVFSDNILLYKIKFNTRKEIKDRGDIYNPKNELPENKAHYIITSSGEIKTDAVLILGEIFINPKDYTIHKINYEGLLESTKKKIYELSLEYGYIDYSETKMGMKYISFNNEFFTIDQNEENYFKVVSSQRINNSHILLRTNAIVDPKNSKSKYFYDILHKGKKIGISKVEIEKNHIKIYLNNPKNINLELSINVRNVRDIEGRVINEKKIVRFYQFRELFAQEFNEKLTFTKKCYLMNLPLHKNCVSSIANEEKYLMNSPLKQ